MKRVRTLAALVVTVHRIMIEWMCISKLLHVLLLELLLSTASVILAATRLPSYHEATVAHCVLALKEWCSVFQEQLFNALLLPG
jgi:hypothetical protein